MDPFRSSDAVTYRSQVNPFRYADKPPCECTWCIKSKPRRATSFAGYMAALVAFLAILSIAVVTLVSIVDYVANSRSKTAPALATPEEPRGCKDSVMSIGSYDKMYSCAPGSTMNLEPVVDGRYRTFTCRCPAAATPAASALAPRWVAPSPTDWAIRNTNGGDIVIRYEDGGP
jgi:hypothetical protein